MGQKMTEAERRRHHDCGCIDAVVSPVFPFEIDWGNACKLHADKQPFEVNEVQVDEGETYEEWEARKERGDVTDSDECPCENTEGEMCACQKGEYDEHTRKFKMEEECMEVEEKQEALFREYYRQNRAARPDNEGHGPGQSAA